MSQETLKIPHYFTMSMTLLTGHPLFLFLYYVTERDIRRCEQVPLGPSEGSEHKKAL